MLRRWSLARLSYIVGIRNAQKYTNENTNTFRSMTQVRKYSRRARKMANATTKFARIYIYSDTADNKTHGFVG